MNEREKVIKGLECYLSMRRGERIVCKAEYCPYWAVDDDIGCDICNHYLIEVDALELLKAQEPVEPTLKGKEPYNYYCCGACDSHISIKDKYCPQCGKAVKWE